MNDHFLSGLAASGYILNKEKEAKKTNTHSNISPRSENEKGLFLQTSKDIEFDTLQNRKLLERQGANMIGNNVTKEARNISTKVPMFQRPSSSRDINHREELLTKSMTGEFVRNDAFSHNNMQPFFGGSVKQNVDDGMCQTILEKYTGVSANSIPKTELESMFPLKQENIYGNQNKTEEFESRYNPSRFQQGVPLNEPIRVGPGLNKGYSSKPSGGFQQQDTRQYALPPTTDEIRVKGNEKKSYEGRVIEGFKRGRRGIQPSVAQNRTIRFHTFDTPRFNTTVVQGKQTQYENFEVKCTKRQDLNQPYSGIAGSTTSSKPKLSLEYNQDNVHKQNLPSYGLRNSNPNGAKRGKVMYCSDIRDTQKEKVNSFVGTASTIVKKMIAPVQDILKTTVRETTEDAAYPEGFVGVPVKKGTVYDTDDVARTTIKETIINNEHSGNVGVPVKKQTIYDNDDSAKTTLKEQNIHDVRLGEVAKLGERSSMALFDVPNKTARETLEQKYSPNISTTYNRGTVYDENTIIPKTTMKQTTISAEEPGIITNVKGQGYLNNPIQIEPTNKQFSSEVEYTGQAQGKSKGGYSIADTVAPDTSRQFISDNDYTGIAQSNDLKQQSYEDIYNMTISTIKQDVAKGRTPTQTGAKSSNGTIGSMHFPEEHQEKLNLQKTYITNNVLNTPVESVTTQKDTLSDEHLADRLDAMNLMAFKNNPFTKSLNSYT